MGVIFDKISTLEEIRHIGTSDINISQEVLVLHKDHNRRNFLDFFISGISRVTGQVENIESHTNGIKKDFSFDLYFSTCIGNQECFQVVYGSHGLV